MKNFANLPTEYVFKSLGIQVRQSGRAVVYELKNLHCGSCKERLCSSCPFKELEKVEIRGLKDSFAYSSTLKSAAIRLYIALFFHVNSDGVCRKVSFGELAEMLRVHEKTINASLKALSKTGYISFSKINARYFEAEILDFKVMYLAGRKGGRGYVTLSKEIFAEIAQIKGLNELRCVIKVLFNSLYNQFKSASKAAAAVVSFDSLREALPRYVKPQVLRKAFKKTESFFEIVKEDYKEFTVVLDKRFQGKTLKEELKKEGKKELPSFVERLNEISDMINSSLMMDGEVSYHARKTMEEEGIQTGEIIRKVTAIRFNSGQMNSLYEMCAEFSVESIKEALRIFYKEYVIKGIKIENNMGLIRAILNERALI